MPNFLSKSPFAPAVLHRLSLHRQPLKLANDQLGAISKFCKVKPERAFSHIIHIDLRRTFTQWCRFLSQSVRKNLRFLCCAATRVSPLRPRDFRAGTLNFYS